MEDYHKRSGMNINIIQSSSSEVTMNLFVSSFNIQDIWKSFRSVRPKGKTQYNFLDGIRVWSMSWVIFGHSFLFFITAGASNLATLVPSWGVSADPNYKYVIQEFYMMFAEYAFYSVDSFFFLSGFLGHFLFTFTYMTPPMNYSEPGVCFVFCIQYSRIFNLEAVEEVSRKESIEFILFMDTFSIFSSLIKNYADDDVYNSYSMAIK